MPCFVGGFSYANLTYDFGPLNSWNKMNLDVSIFWLWESEEKWNSHQPKVGAIYISIYYSCNCKSHKRWMLTTPCLYMNTWQPLPIIKFSDQKCWSQIAASSVATSFVVWFPTDLELMPLNNLWHLLRKKTTLKIQLHQRRPFFHWWAAEISSLSLLLEFLHWDSSMPGTS